MAFGSSQQKATSISPNDCNLGNAGNDGISSIRWSPTANYIASSNWDGGVRCWEVQEQNGQVRSQPKAQVNHEPNSSVLDCCFSSDGSTVFSCGTDKAVRMWQLQGAAPPNGVAQQIGAHDAPVKAVRFLPRTSMIVSGGWDRKLKFWDARSPNPAGVFDMPERVYAMDVRDELLVVGTAGRTIISYDVSGTPREVVRKDSPLKYQTRTISCFPDRTGFAVGSIEGRVAIHYLQKVAGKESFAFKCHRQDSNVFAVNGICFHNQYGTFATVGSDGLVNFWDKDNKQRLKSFPVLQRPVSCAAFNHPGNMFAYAVSYDWHKGSAFHSPSTPDEIFVHHVPDEEMKPKNKKK